MRRCARWQQLSFLPFPLLSSAWTGVKFPVSAASPIVTATGPSLRLLSSSCPLCARSARSRGPPGLAPGSPLPLLPVQPSALHLTSPHLTSPTPMFPLSNYRQRQGPPLPHPRTAHLRSTATLHVNEAALEGVYSNDHYYDPPGHALAGFCSLCRCLLCPAWCAVRDTMEVVACLGCEIGSAIWER